MEIIETSIFSRQVQALLQEEDYRQLQSALVLRPDFGALIPGGGGLRKMRWAGQGHGKRGGVRVLYYWAVSQDRILMLLIMRRASRMT